MTWIYSIDIPAWHVLFQQRLPVHPDVNLVCHVACQAFVSQLREQSGCTPSPYRSHEEWILRSAIRERLWIRSIDRPCAISARSSGARALNFFAIRHDPSPNPQCRFQNLLPCDSHAFSGCLAISVRWPRIPILRFFLLCRRGFWVASASSNDVELNFHGVIKQNSHAVPPSLAARAADPIPTQKRLGCPDALLAADKFCKSPDCLPRDL